MSSILAKNLIAIREIIQIIVQIYTHSSDKGAKNILKSHYLTFGYATNVFYSITPTFKRTSFVVKTNRAGQRSRR